MTLCSPQKNSEREMHFHICLQNGKHLERHMPLVAVHVAGVSLLIDTLGAVEPVDRAVEPVVRLAVPVRPENRQLSGSRRVVRSGCS